MDRRPVCRGVTVALVLGTTCCTGSDSSGRTETLEGQSRAGFPVVVMDDSGRSVALATTPERIVSLVPSATEILIALGQTPRLVGRTDFDAALEVQDLPSVGGGLGASVERIVQLDPDLVVHFLAPSDPDTPRQLEAAGLEHLAIRPDGIEDIRRIVALLGSVTGEATRADSLIASMDRGLRSTAASVADLPRPNVALLGGNPPTAAGPDTFLHELLEIGGGRNAFSDLESLYAPISIEEILRRDVDLILAPEETPIPAALSRVPVREIPLDVLLPGLGVVQSAEHIADLLHPDRAP